jgi:molecular chaperone GrpE (heat shock protein)
MQPVSSEVESVSSLNEPIAEMDREAPTEALPPQPEPEEPAAEVESATSDPVADALARFDARLAEAQRLLERQTEIAASLHAENQRLRAGELRQAQGALVVSVLRVFDDIGQMASTASVPESGRDLGLAAEALADALARNGIERTPIEPGAAFNPQVHRIARVESTDDPAGDRTVAQEVRPGFAWADGTVIRFPEVAVLRHVPAPSNA